MLLQTPDQLDKNIRQKEERQPKQNIDDVHRLLLATFTFPGAQRRFGRGVEGRQEIRKRLTAEPAGPFSPCQCPPKCLRG